MGETKKGRDSLNYSENTITRKIDFDLAELLNEIDDFENELCAMQQIKAQEFGWA